MSPPAPVDPGLCASCRNARVVRGARSVFWSCELSRTDARFPRYPALPVRSCAGWMGRARGTDEIPTGATS